MTHIIRSFIQQSPIIISSPSNDKKDFYVNLALSIFTLLALIVALFQEFIRKYFNRANLKIEIKKHPPDCHQILLTDQNGNPVGESIYIRIRITNLSTSNIAEDTEVFISHFWKINRNGKKKEIKTFLPMNLQWSHTHDIKTNVLPNFYRYCDFGSIRKDNNDSPFLFLDTIVKPNPVSGGKIPYIIDPGKYEFEIVLSGRNIKPTTKRWMFEFKNIWKNTEKAMLKTITFKDLSTKK
jgi:hypothetical protein